MAVRRIDHGDGVEEAVIENDAARIHVLTVGCALRDWRVAGVAAPMILGFADPRAYLANRPWFGAVIGRVANRIAYGRFMLEGREVALPINAPPHHLHGGAIGLARRRWRMEVDSRADTVQLRCDSPDGEDGWPGAVRFSVEISLCGAAVTWRMRGRPDRPTPINLAQHAYYSLGGADTRDCALRVAAARHTPTDATLVPTGAVAPVAGTRFDFTAPRRLSDADPAGRGLDVNLALDEDAGPAAELAAPYGPQLRLWTDRPGLQIYYPPTLDVAGGLDGARYGPFAGLCLEAQGFPDAPNRPAFPSILHTPERPYRQRLTVEIAAGAGR